MSTRLTVKAQPPIPSLYCGRACGKPVRCFDTPETEALALFCRVSGPERPVERSWELKRLSLQGPNRSNKP